jgi:phenylalanyl-tRNA synthetase beta chain
MKFTLSWLKDHLQTEATLAEIIQRLVDLGIEVESVINPGETLHGFVVGHVVECGRHPNADRLSLCQIDTGTGELIQVVCGAANIRKGLKVAFAPVGVVIPALGHPLKKGRIREMDSYGMCCSLSELQLGENHEGIIELAPDAPIGAPLAEVLGLNDPVIEVAITPNRADCFGVRGLARDLAASGLGNLIPLSYPGFKGTFDAPIQVAIEDDKACPDFHGVYLRDVKNGPSPQWVQRRLEAIGLRPINALVDVTNYLSYDLCRPLHVFDADQLSGNITVRLSKPGEKLAALNDKNYELDDQMTVIADANGVLALGGVIGGKASGCTEATTNVLIECAAFDPIRTALTGRKLQILSDARTRFERGIDPESLNYGLDAAVALILEWCGGEASYLVRGKPESLQKKPSSAKPILLTQAKLTGLSGLSLTLDQAQESLIKLGFTVTPTSQALEVVPPSYRLDIHRAEDLIEEVLRLHGYDKIIPVDLPPLKTQVFKETKSDIAKNVLASRGLNEAVTWSFMKEETANLFTDTSLLKLENPISVDLAVMRPSILPNLMEAAIRNHSRGIENSRLFEVGPHYSPQAQIQVACGLCFDQVTPRHWNVIQRSVDVFDAKAHVLAVTHALNLSESAYQIESKAPDYYHPGRSGTIKQGNRILAYFGEIHPHLRRYFDTDIRMVGFEIFLDHFHDSKVKKTPLTLSPYQPVVRDFAFLINQDIKADQVLKTIQKVDRTLITKVEIFDVYQGDKVPEGQKSIALEVRLEPTQKTLTDAEIQELSAKIITQVEKTTGGRLRAS